MMYCEDKLEHLFMFEPSATHEITKYKTFSLEAQSCVNVFYQHSIPTPPTNCCVEGWSLYKYLFCADRKEI